MNHDSVGTLDLSLEVDRSLALEASIDAAWRTLRDDLSGRAKASAILCNLALDHGRAVRMLISRVPPSAIALLRPQYEALVRAVWVRYAATEGDLLRLIAPLTVDSQQAAKKLPGVADMLVALEQSGPSGAAAHLGRARAQLWDGLNSFVHGGIHPLKRGETGYPLPLLSDVLKNANAISMMTLLVLSDVAGDHNVIGLIADLTQEFGAVLPLETKIA